MKEKPRLLIIDDNENMRETLEDLLQEMGYETQTAKTALEGIVRAQESFFNVALIDINLPDKTGIEVLERFRDMFPSRMNIMITASTTLKNAVDAVNLGANGYITKPIDIRKLDQKIKECLKKQAKILKTAEQRLNDFIAGNDEKQLPKTVQ